jgi:hypothetical protein
MSMTKNSANFQRMMEEARQEDECSHELYLEQQYLSMRRERRNSVTNDPQATYNVTPPNKVDKLK